MGTAYIVWLLPSAFFYWQPAFSALTQVFPDTRIFAGCFPGFAKSFKNTIDVEVLNSRKVIAVTESKTSYGDNFIYLSPKIIPKLFKYQPDVIFSSSFGVWSILEILFKLLGGWRVIIAYEGSSPGSDYRNSKLRLLLRRMMVHAVDACRT